MNAEFSVPRVAPHVRVGHADPRFDQSLQLLESAEFVRLAWDHRVQIELAGGPAIFRRPRADVGFPSFARLMIAVVIVIATGAVFVMPVLVMPVLVMPVFVMPMFVMIVFVVVVSAARPVNVFVLGFVFVMMIVAAAGAVFVMVVMSVIAFRAVFVIVPAFVMMIVRFFLYLMRFVTGHTTFSRLIQWR